MSTFTFSEVFVKFLSVLNMPGVFEVVDDLRSLCVMQTKSFYDSRLFTFRVKKYFPFFELAFLTTLVSCPPLFFRCFSDTPMGSFSK